MQISHNNLKEKLNFKNCLGLSSSVQQNAVLNRALIETGGIVPWLIKTNNNEELKERIINLSIFFALAFFAPILNVPFANRIAMKFCGLTDSIFDNNHKAIQLSNEYLTNKDKVIEGLKKYNTTSNAVNKKSLEKFYTSPIEKFYNKIKGRKENNNINMKKLLEKCNNSPELLRKRLIKSKNWVLFSDLIISGITLGFLGFLNNYLTEKRTGKSGFSAELEMADSKIIEERSAQYKKNKKRNINILLAEIALLSGVVPLAINKGLSSNKVNRLTKFVKAHPNLTNYTKGIYMSRFTMLLTMIMNLSGLSLAARNNTEKKDLAIRNSIIIPVFLGGDLLTTSLISSIFDKVFNTKLTEKSNNKGILRKIFPKFKSLEKINEEVSKGMVSKKHKGLATGVYWGNMALCAASIAYFVPTICNKMIKQDVSNYVHKKNINASSFNPIKSEVFKSFQLHN